MEYEYGSLVITESGETGFYMGDLYVGSFDDEVVYHRVMLDDGIHLEEQYSLTTFEDDEE